MKKTLRVLRCTVNRYKELLLFSNSTLEITAVIKT